LLLLPKRRVGLGVLGALVGLGVGNLVGLRVGFGLVGLRVVGALVGLGVGSGVTGAGVGMTGAEVARTGAGVGMTGAKL
jgi:hypothetical protein